MYISLSIFLLSILVYKYIYSFVSFIFVYVLPYTAYLLICVNLREKKIFTFFNLRSFLYHVFLFKYLFSTIFTFIYFTAQVLNIYLISLLSWLSFFFTSTSIIFFIFLSVHFPCFNLYCFMSLLFFIYVQQIITTVFIYLIWFILNLCFLLC